MGLLEFDYCVLKQDLRHHATELWNFNFAYIKHITGGKIFGLSH